MIPLEIEDIKKILPHRYPMLLIDRVIELDPGKKVTAIKRISINEVFFQGHFPGRPIMPGAMIVEAMAQASILLYHTGYEKDLRSVPDYYLGSVKARFLQPVFPGDELKLEAETVKLIPTGAFVSTKAFAKDKLAAEAELVFAVKRS